MKNRIRFKSHQNRTHTSSTLTLENATPKDTGYFGCTAKGHYMKTLLLWMSQYVYVSSTLNFFSSIQY